LQTSNAVGAAASQLGPDAHAAMVILNKDLGLSHGKVAAVFQQLFGIRVARATSARSLKRTARRCLPTVRQIRARIRAGPWAVPDETGWRVGGRNAWLHVAVGPQATWYGISPHRSHYPLANLLGPNWAGVLVHDGWSPYDQLPHVRHQQCLAHLLRRCHELLETATGAAVRFPRRIMELLQRALALRNRHAAAELSDHGLAVARGRLQFQLEDAIYPTKINADNERLAQHLWNHRGDLLTFLQTPGLDATNWRAEQAIRPAVVNRKVWGGNRTWYGAWIQGLLLSVLRTCRQQERDPLADMHALLCSPKPLALLSGGR
jgi:transposase